MIESFLSNCESRLNGIRILPVSSRRRKMGVDVVHRWNDRRNVRSASWKKKSRIFKNLDEEWFSEI